MDTVRIADEAPEPCDLAIVGGTVLDPVTTLADAFVAVVGSAVAAVGPRAEIAARWAPRRTLDATGAVVVPGFVDAHVHLGALAGPARPYAPPTGPGPLARPGAVEAFAPLIARIGSMPVSADQVTEAVVPILGAMLRVGCTGVVDAGGPHPAAVLAAAREVGIRAVVGPHLADVWPSEPDAAPRTHLDATALLDDARAFVAAHDDPTGTVRAGASGVWSLTSSDALLAGLGELAAEGFPVHVHTHCLPGDAETHGRWFGAGRTATARLRDAGLLAPGVVLMHAGHLTDDDADAIAAGGATVDHNPLGNALLGFGVAATGAIPALLARGVPLVLGSDTAPAMFATPFDTMRAFLALHRDASGNDAAVTLEQALVAATDGGVALGRPGELGRVAPGYLADLVVLDATPPPFPTPPGGHHPLPTTVLQGRPDAVRAVVVDGNVRVDARA